MAAKDNYKRTPKHAGGQAGMRGYLVQTLVALLDAVLADPPFESLTLEPSHESDQFDLVWKDVEGNHAVQVKSTNGQFTLAQVKRLAQELESSAPADEYRLCLVGLHAASLAKMTRIGKVLLDMKNLNIEAFRAEAAHRLDRFLCAEELAPGSADDREMLADALIGRLAAYSTTGTQLGCEELVKLLRRWVDEALPEMPRVFLAKLPQTDREFLGREVELQLLDDAWADTKHTHIVQLVAPGGVGKTSLIKRWIERLRVDSWRGAQRVYGWSFYSQGTSEDRQASEDEFLADALAWFRVEHDPKLLPWDKGRMLAETMAKERSLLVLDGVEPLQHPPSPLGGQLRAPGLQTILRQFAAAGHPGLCILSTRETVRDVDEWQRTRDHPVGSVAHYDLGNLGDADGSCLLHRLGVRHAGPAKISDNDAELQSASRAVQGHALTLRLLGGYLARAYGGDIRRWDQVNFQKADAEYKINPADAEKTYGHAFKVMAAYEQWLGSGGERGQRQLAVLYLLGLFDRPADPGCLAALRNPPVISGLTDPLIVEHKGLLIVPPIPIRDEDWNLILADLADCGLVSIQGAEGSVSPVDAHPLIREYFAKKLGEKNPEAWHFAHQRLYEHLRDNTEDKIEPTLADLDPLYQAVAHGCQARLQVQSCFHFYLDRVQRGQYYPALNLGAMGSELQAIACFFEEPWERPLEGLSKPAVAWLLNEAGVRLRSVGRLAESLRPLRIGLDVRWQQEDWKNVVITLGNIAEVGLLLGEIVDAIDVAKNSVKKADCCDEWMHRVVNRTTLADALAKGGLHADSLAVFQEAEALQGLGRPKYPLLPSILGFRYCDILLSEAERTAWSIFLCSELAPGAIDSCISICRQVEERARRTQGWAGIAHVAILITTAVDDLTLSRLALYRTILTRSSPDSRLLINTTVDDLRHAGQQDYIPHGLLTRAWTRSLNEDTDGARSDLDEAWQIAERGSMRLHMADIHLYRARLFHDKDELKKARALIEQCGYWRRKEELEDAEVAAETWP